MRLDWSANARSRLFCCTGQLRSVPDSPRLTETRQAQKPLQTRYVHKSPGWRSGARQAENQSCRVQGKRWQDVDIDAVEEPFAVWPLGVGMLLTCATLLSLVIVPL